MSDGKYTHSYISSRSFGYVYHTEIFNCQDTIDNLGLIEYLIDQLWSELEYVPDDLTSVFPRRFPSEPISRYALKVNDILESKYLLSIEFFFSLFSPY